MKKDKLRMMAIAASALLLTTGFTACGGDDDDDPIQETEEQKSYFDRELETADVTYEVRLGKDELSLYDVEVEYRGDDKKDNTITMTNATWSKTYHLTKASLPGDFVLRARPKLKEGLQLDKDAKFEVGCITKIIVKVKNKYGRLICDVDGMGLVQTEFVTMTTEQIVNPWSSWASDLMGSLFSQDKKTVEVYDNKIVYNDMTQRYW
ncbi:MAG: hypothetical protein II864_01370 [Prevotella sp.]|jgi:hypothetical protein|nr:hypothetical protein [Prevotella sp.]